MEIQEFNHQLFSDLVRSNNSAETGSSSQIYLSLLGQAIPTDSLVILGGRPRTGKTSLLLDFAARNSLLPIPENKAFHNETTPKKGLIFFLGQKQELVLRRWFSIINQRMTTEESLQVLDYHAEVYKRKIEGAKIDFHFLTDTENLISNIENEIKKTDPDYIIIDQLNFAPDFANYTPEFTNNDNDLLSDLIHLQKKTKKMFLLATSLGHDAWYRSGNNKHCLEDLHSHLIEQNADMVLMLHRPELFGIDIDADGNSLAGIVEVDCVLNRYGQERISRRWGSISEIPELIKN